MHGMRSLCFINNSTQLTSSEERKKKRKNFSALKPARLPWFQRN